MRTIVLSAVLLPAVAVAAAIEVTEFPVPVVGSRPVAVAATAEGTIWFTDAGADRVGRRTASGSISLVALPLLSGPAGITVGADGAAWVALNDRSQIARVTEDGDVTEYATPTSGSQPFGIAAGPDGNVWFTEIGGNQIGRITPDGVMTEFPLPNPVSAPAGIAAGPDGALWFTQFNGNRIGRISIEGAITEFPLPIPASGPLGIARGVDGHLWFTEFHGNRIGRISTQGSIIELDIATLHSNPGGITVTSDGTVWFTALNADQVGRITFTGVRSEVTLPSHSFEGGTLFAGGMTATSDDIVWLAATASGALAKLEEPRTPTPTFVLPPATTTAPASVTPTASPAPTGPDGTATPTATATVPASATSTEGPTAPPPTPVVTPAFPQSTGGGDGCNIPAASQSAGVAWGVIVLAALCASLRACWRIKTPVTRRRQGVRVSVLALACMTMPLASRLEAQATVRMEIGSALGGPGDVVPITVSLFSENVGVVATANDIIFPTRPLDLDPGACQVNPAIGKRLTGSVISAGDAVTTVRILIQSVENTAPIPDGVLYTCLVRVAPSALPDRYRLENSLALAFASDGTEIGDVLGTDGAVVVSLIGRVCRGDCDQDGTVTVDEILTGVNVALGFQPSTACLSFDADADGAVTIEELLGAVSNALGGCHTPPTPVPTPTPTPTAVSTPLFVRATGSDDNDGLSADTALRTITRATQLAQRGYTVIVGPGTYNEGVTTDGTTRAARNLTFIADAAGSATGDPAGPVLIDATGTPTGAGFKLSGALGTVIDGFQITGGADGGIVIKSSSNDFTIRNCVIFDNPGSGVRVQDSARVLVFNNLIYGNGAQGIGIVGQGDGSPDARLFNNTIVGNGNRGITIGTSQVASPGALVLNNIVQDNGNAAAPPVGNLKVFTTPPSDAGYNGDFNLVFPPSYTPIDLTGPSDIDQDALFEFPGGDNFFLRTESPAVDRGDRLPRALELVLMARTTTGRGPDRGRLDLGFHALP